MQLAELAQNYQNPLFNSALTFLEVFPVGLIATPVSAGILRRKPRQGEPVSAVPQCRPKGGAHRAYEPFSGRQGFSKGISQAKKC